MRDTVLDRQIAAAGGFIEGWSSLFSRAEAARKAGGAPPAEEAGRFTEERNALVQRYPELMTQLEIPIHADDELMQILGRSGSLDAVLQMPETQWKKLSEMQAHAEVTLRGLLGALEGRRRAIESVNRSGILVRRLLCSWPLKLLYLVAAILGAFVALKVFVV